MADMKFTDEHEYISVEGDIGTVGITDYAQEQMGDVVFVELPDTGKKLNKGEEAAVVESVKAASEVSAPASGEVIETNTRLDDNPAGVNEDAMGQGWFFKIRLADRGDLEDLMDEAAYKAFIEGQ